MNTHRKRQVNTHYTSLDQGVIDVKPNSNQNPPRQTKTSTRKASFLSWGSRPQAKNQNNQNNYLRNSNHHSESPAGYPPGCGLNLLIKAKPSEPPHRNSEMLRNAKADVSCNSNFEK